MRGAPANLLADVFERSSVERLRRRARAIGTGRSKLAGTDVIRPIVQGAVARAGRAGRARRACGRVSRRWAFFPSRCFRRPGRWRAALSRSSPNFRLVNDAIASLFRVGVGFLLAVGLGVPPGSAAGPLGQGPRGVPAAGQLLPQPLAAGVDPFAILWLGIGDPPAIFLIFMAAVLPGRALDDGRRRQHSERLLPRRARRRHRGPARCCAR